MNKIPATLVRYITESHLDYQGGYPFDSAVIGNELVVAEVDDEDQTHLRRYSIDALLLWHENAKQFKRTERCDWTTAFIETRSPSI